MEHKNVAKRNDFVLLPPVLSAHTEYRLHKDGIVSVSSSL